MKLSLNLFTHNLTISLRRKRQARRKRRLVTVAQCTEELDVHRHTINRYIKQGRLKCHGRSYRGRGSGRHPRLIDIEEVRKELNKV